MEIIQIYTGSALRNFSYLVYSKESKEAYCIDPFDASQVSDEVRRHNLNLKAIINTHEHPDHICGNHDLAEKFQVPVYAHENAKNKIPNISKLLCAGDSIKLSNSDELSVMFTPGHTFAHLCLKITSKNKEFGVITGDTLFNAGVGNCHNGGDPETLYETFASQFFNLDNHIKVYPGHEYWENNLGFTKSREPENPYLDEINALYIEKKLKGEYLISDIEMEKKVNVFFRLQQKQVTSNLNLSCTKEKEVFVSLRELRNKW
jgi:hydroxyacylglutathione hydrolase